jgi:nitrile hydratase
VGSGWLLLLAERGNGAKMKGDSAHAMSEPKSESDFHHHGSGGDHDSHDHGSELSDIELRVRALETILTEKGYLDPIIEYFESKTGPHNGARVIAKSWADPAFKRALLEDATKASVR